MAKKLNSKVLLTSAATLGMTATAAGLYFYSGSVDAELQAEVGKLQMPTSNASTAPKVAEKKTDDKVVEVAQPAENVDISDLEASVAENNDALESSLMGQDESVVTPTDSVEEVAPQAETQSVSIASSESVKPSPQAMVFKPVVNPTSTESKTESTTQPEKVEETKPVDTVVDAKPADDTNKMDESKSADDASVDNTKPAETPTDPTNTGEPVNTPEENNLFTEEGMRAERERLAKLEEESIKAEEELKRQASAQPAETLAQPAETPTVTPVVAPSASVTDNQGVTSYPMGECTWGAKVLAPWAGDYWGNGGQWAASAAAAGFRTGSTPQVGAIASWDDGGYGHVAVVTGVNPDNGQIQVMESNVNGNRTIGNYRGWFNPTNVQGTVTYIYPN